MLLFASDLKRLDGIFTTVRVPSMCTATIPGLGRSIGKMGMPTEDILMILLIFGVLCAAWIAICLGCWFMFRFISRSIDNMEFRSKKGRSIFYLDETFGSNNTKDL